MRNFTQVLFFSLLALAGYSQEDFNFELISNTNVGETGNDVWGYVDSTGTEYAIMGSQTKTTIWSLEDPANPIERATIPGPSGVWRDIKSFEDHLYVTSDQGTDGLLIIDMSGAPEVITSEYWKPNLTVGGFDIPLEKCHNLFIDTEQGYCYLSGCNVSNGGVLILDLNIDKKVPVHVGTADIYYSHDVFVRNNRMYTSDIFEGQFNVYDVTDKTNPILLNGQSTSRLFTHNAWISDDENYLFTTDERGNAWVDAFDISDLENIKFLDRYKPLETIDQGVVPHNTHYIDGYLVTSWYTDGVVVNDVTRPDNMIKVASYDTEFNLTSGTNGCWGAYPWLPSGLVLASDRSDGLFVLQPKTNSGENGYQRASYLEGIVTDAFTGQAIPNVQVTISSDDPNLEATNIMGEYKTGQVTEGEFSVEFSHPNYDPLTATAVLISGEVTILNVELGNFPISGTVVDKETGEGIEGASIVIENRTENIRILATTIDDGSWQAGARAGFNYDVYAAKWGHQGSEQNIDFEEGVTVDLELEEGYQDDFFTDLGWTTSATSPTGRWEIGNPQTITSGGQVTQTADDIPIDIGTTYYVTGDDGTNGGDDDIDDGDVTLTSPMMDFSTDDKIDFSFYLWFANAGGSGTPNDFVQVILTNGTETIILAEDNTNGDMWSDKYEITVDKEMIPFNNTMQVVVFAIDQGAGHIAEAGFDAFNALGYITTDVNDLTEESINLTVYPNPADSYINLNVKDLWSGNQTMIITDNSGRTVMSKAIRNLESKFDVTNLVTGIYSVQIIGKNKKSETLRLVKK